MRLPAALPALIGIVLSFGSVAGHAQPAGDTAARIAIDTPNLRGSISLEGARIDDLALVHHRETSDPSSAMVRLMAPLGGASPLYAAFGWVAQPGAAPTLPDARSSWRQEGSGALSPGKPVTLVWDNPEGLQFRRTIAVDDRFLFTIRDEVTNTGSAPVTIYPFGFIARHGTPPTLGLYTVQEGPVGVMGDQGLQEETYAGLRDRKDVRWSAANAWFGLTDRYWARILLPPSQEPAQIRFSSFKVDGLDAYQTDYLLGARTIAPGGRASVDVHLFAGAKELAAIDDYDKALKLDRFGLLIDWGWFWFFTKPLMLALNVLAGFAGSYGVAILLLAVVVRLILFPFANATYAATARRRAGQADTSRTMRRIFIATQIIVQFALYKALLVAVEFRHASFPGWIADLSAPDPTNVFNLFGLIPFDPTAVPLFGPLLDLGAWPALMCITSLILVRLAPEPADPTYKVLYNATPLMIAYTIAAWPAGTAIYWTWNSVLSVLHQFAIARYHGAVPKLIDRPRVTARRADASVPVTASGGTSSQARIWTGAQVMRSVRNASRLVFWISAILLLISTTESALASVGLFAAATAFLSIVVYLVALPLGQTFAGREFAEELADPAGSGRPVVLFLRSFGIARSSLIGRLWSELGYIIKTSVNGSIAAVTGDTGGFADRRYDVEENLDDAIGNRVMFVAIGDRLASYGAAKIKVADKDWQNTFARLAEASQLVFVMPGPSEALMWEMQQIAGSDDLMRKTIFIMPRERGGLSKTWQQASEMAERFGYCLPPYRAEGCYFRIGADGRATMTAGLEPLTRALRTSVTEADRQGGIDIDALWVRSGATAVAAGQGSLTPPRS